MVHLALVNEGFRSLNPTGHFVYNVVFLGQALDVSFGS